MEAKFTKGDWVVDYKGTIGTVKALVDAEYNITPTVAAYQITPSIIHNNEAEANAHLIAAAPDMYAMIKELAHELNIAIDECNEYRAKGINSSAESEPDYIDKQTVHEAQVLLATARGEK